MRATDEIHFFYSIRHVHLFRHVYLSKMIFVSHRSYSNRCPTVLLKCRRLENTTVQVLSILFFYLLFTPPSFPLSSLHSLLPSGLTSFLHSCLPVFLPSFLLSFLSGRLSIFLSFSLFLDLSLCLPLFLSPSLSLSLSLSLSSSFFIFNLVLFLLISLSALPPSLCQPQFISLIASRNFFRFLPLWYSRNFEPVPMSQDHKPSREDEAQRIRDAGGFIINNRCRVTYLFYSEHYATLYTLQYFSISFRSVSDQSSSLPLPPSCRVMGELAVSRAFGDSEFKKGVQVRIEQIIYYPISFISQQ